jgi:hypothetical protein
MCFESPSGPGCGWPAFSFHRILLDGLWCAAEKYNCEQTWVRFAVTQAPVLDSRA